MIDLYVNTDASSGGDGSQANPYNTLAAALISANYPTTRTDNVTLHCSGATAITTKTTISASMTSSSYHLYIEGNLDGATWDSSKFHINISSDDGFDILTSYLHLNKIQVYITATGFAEIAIYHEGSGYLWMSNCILRGTPSTTGDQWYHSGFEGNNSGATYYIWNNIIYDFRKASYNSGVSAGIWNHNGDYLYAYNNTIYNCECGIVCGTERGGGATHVIAKNNIVKDCAQYNFCDSESHDPVANTGAFDSTSTSNTSSDTYRPTTDSTNLISQTINFVNQTNRDLRITGDNSGCIDNAENLSSDSHIAFSTDIVGKSRPSGSWDRGAFEYAVSAYPIYYFYA